MNFLNILQNENNAEQLSNVLKAKKIKKSQVNKQLKNILDLTKINESLTHYTDNMDARPLIIIYLQNQLAAPQYANKPVSANALNLVRALTKETQWVH